MKKPTHYQLSAYQFIRLSGRLLLALSIMFGCTGRYGRLAISQAVKMQIESYDVLPDHRYYYSGSEARPRAVIGVHESFQLQSDLWVPVALTSERLRRWVDYSGVNSKYVQGHNGAEILADDGRRIGVWYAFVDWHDWASVKMIDDSTVRITTPIVRSEPPWFLKFGIDWSD